MPSPLATPTFDAGHGLGPGARRALAAIAEAVFATETGPPPADRIAWLCDDLDDFFARAGAKSRWVFRLSLVAVSVLAPLVARKFRPLASLSVEERVHALERFERSSLGLSLLAVKAMLCVVYYEHPDAAREMGFDGGCMLTAGAAEKRA